MKHLTIRKHLFCVWFCVFSIIYKHFHICIFINVSMDAGHIFFKRNPAFSSTCRLLVFFLIASAFTADIPSSWKAKFTTRHSACVPSQHQCRIRHDILLDRKVNNRTHYVLLHTNPTSRPIFIQNISYHAILPIFQNYVFFIFHFTVPLSSCFLLSAAPETACPDRG